MDNFFKETILNSSVSYHEHKDIGDLKIKIKTRDQGNKQVSMLAFSLSVSTKSKILSHSFDTIYRLQKTGTIMGCI